MRAAQLTARWILPLGLVMAGLVLAVVATTQTLVGLGIVLAGAGVLVWVANRLLRLSFESNEDRDREERARRY